MALLRILPLALVAVSFCRADDLGDDLLAATRKGDLAQVKALLDKGAKVDSKSPYGSTPLFFACDRGYFEIVKVLVERGADVNVEDTFYHASALSWAAQKKHYDVVAYLLDKGAKSAGDMLAMGTQMGDAKFVKIALDKGGIEKKDLSESFAAATKRKNEEIIGMLKAAGAVLPEPVKTVELDAATLGALAGTYSGGRGGTEFEMTFTVKGGALSGAMIGQPPLTYAASDKTHFHSVEFQGINLEFKEGAFTLTQGTQQIDFKKKVQK